MFHANVLTIFIHLQLTVHGDDVHRYLPSSTLIDMQIQRPVLNTSFRNVNKNFIKTNKKLLGTTFIQISTQISA